MHIVSFIMFYHINYIILNIIKYKLYYINFKLKNIMSKDNYLHIFNLLADVYDTGHGFCGWFLMILSYIIMLATFPISICFCIKVVQEYERAVIFRLGRLIGGGAKGPGIFFVMPCIESYTKVDLRTVSFNVPPQEILTKDSVTVSVDAVVYYRISQATISVANVENCHHSTRLLAQTTLRNMLGMKNLSDILADREHIASYMQVLNYHFIYIYILLLL